MIVFRISFVSSLLASFAVVAHAASVTAAASSKNTERSAFLAEARVTCQQTFDFTACLHDVTRSDGHVLMADLWTQGQPVAKGDPVASAYQSCVEERFKEYEVCMEGMMGTKDLATIEVHKGQQQQLRGVGNGAATNEVTSGDQLH